MKYIITEQQYKVLTEQSDYMMDRRANALLNATGIRSDKDYKTVNNTISGINNVDLVGKFLDSREKIETKAKLLYNTANLNNKTPYQNMKDKEDAFCHQTASAYATSLFGGNIGYIIGQMNELKGAFRIFFKGGKNTPKYTKFNSGYQTDTNNNNLGIKLAQQFPRKTLEDYMSLVQKNINNNVYYNKSNKYMKNK